MVDSMLNTGVLFLVPLNVWDDFDLNASISVCVCVCVCICVCDYILYLWPYS